MTEKSYYWDGTATGDASLAPYNEFVYHGIWGKLFMSDITTEGVICGYENKLEVVGVSGGVTVDIGAALVAGMFYENTKKLTIAIPIPSSSTRIDNIVLRRDVNAQTIRAIRVAGVEGGSAPSLTQIQNGTWEIKIAEISITTAGAITVTDYRQCIRMPSIRKSKKYTLIEEKNNIAGETSVVFSNIPQTYTHLKLVILVAFQNGGAGSSGVELLINEDATDAKYNDQFISSFPATSLAAGASNSVPCKAVTGGNTDGVEACFVTIPFYTEEDFYKSYFSQDMSTYSRTVNIECWTFESTNPVTSLEIASCLGYEFSDGCKFSLYGIG